MVEYFLVFRETTYGFCRTFMYIGHNFNEMDLLFLHIAIGDPVCDEHGHTDTSTNGFYATTGFI